MSERENQGQKAKQRLSAALRENLRRRKAQAKGRMEEPAEGHRNGRSPVDEHAARPHDSAGFGEEK